MRLVAIRLCQPCLDGVGSECHTPGCAAFLHRVDLPFSKESYEVLPEDPAGAIEKARQVLKDLIEIVDSIPESRLLALDIDPHPPSSLSVLADEAKKALAALTAETQEEGA